MKNNELIPPLAYNSVRRQAGRHVLYMDTGPMDIMSMDSDLTVFTATDREPARVRCEYCRVLSPKFDVCPRCGAPR